MKNMLGWSRWSIAIKITSTFLALSVISMGLIGYFALVNIRNLGSYAIQTSSSVGESAIQDSTSHLTRLGEELINQKASDVAKQVAMYLESKPAMSLEQMRNDTVLRGIVVQPVGTTGYTTLIDPSSFEIIIHKYREQEKNLQSLKDYLPSFWRLLISSKEEITSAGYYDWQEVDMSIRQKYAAIVHITNGDGGDLTLWATTYIDEFSQPAVDTAKEINAAIFTSREYIHDSVTQMQNTFIVTFTILAFLVIGLALLLSWVLTSPITVLKRGAEAIGEGNLDYVIEVDNKDELGQLANSFNMMRVALKKNNDEIQRSAAENIEKERRIQDNLRLYATRVSLAQEAERKRIARELHDETAQALIVVLRHLDDLANGNSKLDANEIRQEVRIILEGVRHYSQELRPSILDNLGLIPALNWLASDLTKNYGIEVETSVEGNQRKLPSETELTLFRITQEAFTNIRKHSQASKAMLKISFSELKVKISIQDNGQGFDLPAHIGDLSKTGKLGMIGMHERAQLLGGTLNVESQEGKGTTVTVEVPIS